METSSTVLVETSLSRLGYVYRKTITAFRTYSLQVCNVPLVWGYQNVLNTKQNVTKSVHVGFYFSILHVLKTEF